MRVGRYVSCQKRKEGRKERVLRNRKRKTESGKEKNGEMGREMEEKE